MGQPAGGHTCAVLARTGGLQCWGYNNAGQLGDETAAGFRLSPVFVKRLMSGVTAAAAGGGHTCALTSAGGLKCWGDNSVGQLGDGTITDRRTPVDVRGLTRGVVRVNAGVNHTCAGISTGRVKCWGSNLFGQLGDGTAVDRLTPVFVKFLGGVRVVVAGLSHTCALVSPGGVRCWGRNNFGQLGDGTTADRSSAAFVVGLTSGVRSIAAGKDHTCAVMNSGTAKCWGYNKYGQLGDGTTTNRPTPVDVLGL
jgi:alpha-tubulin suppressor-like RCC1 family protein